MGTLNWVLIGSAKLLNCVSLQLLSRRTTASPLPVNVQASSLSRARQHTEEGCHGERTNGGMLRVLVLLTRATPRQEDRCAISPAVWASLRHPALTQVFAPVRCIVSDDVVSTARHVSRNRRQQATTPPERSNTDRMLHPARTHPGVKGRLRGELRGASNQCRFESHIFRQVDRCACSGTVVLCFLRRQSRTVERSQRCRSRLKCFSRPYLH